ncbi:glycosyltransferase family 2 protein [Pseudoalteromonas piscicida]|uniref:glycosyltransferase family 2 protein n=1 Tax=Pseudoalteromonas piscicida TaxID=43662 RepID=UPI0030C9A659
MKLSIITITFNDVDGLKRTCESVAAQRFTNYEHIIIDGASNDGTSSFLSQWSESNQYMKFISERDSGIYNAMNKGIKMASGEWILFLNAGDEFVNSNTLSDAFVKNEFDEVEVQVVFGHKLNKYGDTITSSAVGASLKAGELFACHQSIFFKDRTLYDESYKIFGDFDLLSKLYNKYGESGFKGINQAIAIFEGGGISSQVSFIKRKEKVKALYKNFGFKAIFKNYIASPLVWKKLFFYKEYNK